MSDSIYFINQCHRLHLHSLYLHLSHTLNIPILFTAIPQQIMSLILCIWWSTTLCNTVQLLVVRCAAMLLWSTLTALYICISWFMNLLEYMTIHNFLHRVCGIILNMCSGFMCCLRVLISRSSWLVLWFFFISGLVQVLLLSFVV
jgi:hypothetical protein